jgi:hypothetical protein
VSQAVLDADETLTHASPVVHQHGHEVHCEILQHQVAGRPVDRHDGADRHGLQDALEAVSRIRVAIISLSSSGPLAVEELRVLPSVSVSGGRKRHVEELTGLERPAPRLVEPKRHGTFPRYRGGFVPKTLQWSALLRWHSYLGHRHQLLYVRPSGLRVAKPRSPLGAVSGWAKEPFALSR